MKFLTPIFLAVFLALKLITDFKTPYENYPQAALIGLGWSMPIIAFIVGAILAKLKEKYINK